MFLVSEFLGLRSFGIQGLVAGKCKNICIYVNKGVMEDERRTGKCELGCIGCLSEGYIYFSIYVAYQSIFGVYS